jgi:hypothetical protein
MRYQAKVITLDEARHALRLDDGKSAEDIAAILARRGIEAEAALDDAMTPADIRQDGICASVDLVALQADPTLFRIKALELDDSGSVSQAYDWQQGEQPFAWEAN